MPSACQGVMSSFSPALSTAKRAGSPWTVTVLISSTAASRLNRDSAWVAVARIRTEEFISVVPGR